MKTRQQWIEVDSACFESRGRSGVFETTILINHCTQLKRSVKRVRDAITLNGTTREECDSAVSRYCESPGVVLLPKEQP